MWSGGLEEKTTAKARKREGEDCANLSDWSKRQTFQYAVPFEQPGDPTYFALSRLRGSGLPER